MTSEFDKEIDALLQQAAKGETASIVNLNSAHLDADEISAFVDNALPEKIKQKYTIHLADCSRCRSILSNLIALNSEAETEIVQAVKPEKVVTVVIPWYRKLFAYPNLAFTMGALLLAFTGLVAFVVLQNKNNSPGLEISQISEKTEKSQGPSFDESLPAPESFSNSMSSNSSMSTNSMMSNAAPNVSNTNFAAVYKENKLTNPSAANLNTSAAPKPNVPAVEPPKPELSNNNFALLPNRSNLQTQAANTNATAKKEQLRKEANQNKEAKTLTDADTAKPAPNQTAEQLPVNGRNTGSEALRAARAKEKAQENSEIISFGGKTFKRANNVWTDSAYKGQTTTSISRGTNEYKKLDFGLRSIAENLGGTVVIVWKEKAYRIQ